MESNNYPVRQCIGCRKVRPKNELLRFARLQSSPTFDYRNNLEGRGFYLCPSNDCFIAANRNKKVRNVYFPKQDNFEGVKREVLGTILKSINRDLKLCKRMGYSFHTSNVEKSIHGDDEVLLWCDNLPEEKVPMHASAIVRESKLFLFQMEDLGILSYNCIVNHFNFIVSRLMVNLQKYEMLSSKGPVL